MSRNRGLWDDGRSAWERLLDWRQRTLDAVARPGDGGEALNALGDIGSLRRLLDQAELAAVLAARRDSKSWAEIATMLGVTRQSAWERWRDLDDEAARPMEAATATATAPAEPAEVPDVAAQVNELGSDAANRLRRQSWVKVPNLIGMSVQDALAALHNNGLTAANGEPHVAPLEALASRDSIVAQQTPESGARVPPGFTVRLWITRRGGGSAGVREPRRPGPSPLTAREMRSDPADEPTAKAIG